jgi:N-methylhydantoinase A
MTIRLGVDIGGTFTDFCAFDEQTQALHTLKVRSRPEAPGQEILDGLEQLESRYGLRSEDITYFTHGTTVGINTVIQRKGLKLCLFCTENFVDVLEVARLKMPDPYHLLSTRPVPLISRDRVLPVRERLRADGSVDTPVDAASVAGAVSRARALGAEGIVIAFINAYRNPVHEHEVRAQVELLAPDLPVFCSADVWSIIREYERTLTAIIHGYVQPRVSHYLSSLQASLRERGVPADAMITKSNGGVMSAELAKRDCAQMILSGTASGVIGASHVARLAGVKHCLSLDIGGTSADVAFIVNGEPHYGVGEMIGEFPIFVPTVAVTSIGAGGGSIAWLDEFAVLQVGPQSAGATPGPACYGRGGEAATITDAMAVLGVVGQSSLGYQSIDVDRERARRAVAALAVPLGRTVQQTAQAIVDIAVSQMYLEVSKLASRHGIDLREFSLLAFGGAGPMLGCLLAEELGMHEVLVPSTPGVLSALGGLVADIKNDFITTVFLDLDIAHVEVLQAETAQLEARARGWLRNEQHHNGDYRLLYSADMRYRGQSFEIETPLDPRWLEAGNLSAIAQCFHQQHERVYEYGDPDAQVQIINLRLVVAGASAKPTFAPAEFEPHAAAPSQRVQVHMQEQARELGLYARSALPPGAYFAGPAIVSQEDCTTWIPGPAQVSLDAFGNLRIASATTAGVGERNEY